jgi:hypothetical protein
VNGAAIRKKNKIAGFMEFSRSHRNRDCPALKLALT